MNTDTNKNEDTLPGELILQEIIHSEIKFIVSVPDIITSDGLLWPISKNDYFKLIRVCKEDEGVSICAGLSFSNHKSLLLIQHTGFLDSINAIRAIAVEYELPVCMMIGLQGKEPSLLPDESSSYGVRIVIPILKAMGLKYYLLQNTSDIKYIVPAIDEAYKNNQPVAIIVGKPLV